MNSFINKNNSGKRPVNFNHGTTDIMANQHRTPIDFKNGPSDIYTSTQQKSNAYTAAPVVVQSKIVDEYRDQQNTTENDDDDDDEFAKLMQRHDAEKQKVNAFDQSRNTNVEPRNVMNEMLDSIDNDDSLNEDSRNGGQIQLEDNLITT